MKNADDPRQAPETPYWQDEGWYSHYRREGYFEAAYVQLEKRLASVYHQFHEERKAWALATTRIKELEDSSEDWRQIAMYYGTRTSADKRKEIGQLHGRVAIDRELLAQSDGRVIDYVCISLAKKLRAVAVALPPK